MFRSHKVIWVFGLLAISFASFHFLGCNKSDSPFGVNAPSGLDVPTTTPTPSTGSFNCYVYDGVPNAGGSPKQGVTIVLLDPAGNTVNSNFTDQFGNAVFNPSPLSTGVYFAIVQKQGKYGLSSIPVTIGSLTQGPVSVQFWQANQNLTLIGGTPVSFTSGNGSFPITLSYNQPGNLDIPISITNSPISTAFNIFPTIFVMNKTQFTMPVTINKSSCAVLNQPITFVGSDFLGNASVSVGTTIFRNFPVNIVLSASTTVISCSPGHFGQYQTIFTLSSPNDCGLSWNLSGFIGASTDKITFNSYLSNTGTINSSTFRYPANSTCLNPPAASSAITLSSPLGTIIGSGLSGTLINTSF